MNLLAEFKGFIGKEGLFGRKDRLLLAVSGGVDSVVLCELCRQAGYNFSIAHCNFQLRGEESTRDEHFVRELAQHYNVPFFLRHFETEAYASQHKCSIQVAARQLRYEWFNVLAQESPDPRSRTFIVTAHHANDNVETVLMNLFKGTGITGLRGILPKQNTLVRPLLFATKESIKDFAQKNNLSWVEDSSNLSDKYARNFIRMQVLPLITKLYPQAAANMINTIERFREVELLYDQSLQKLLKKMVETKGNELHIPILRLQKSGAASSALFELLSPLGFTSAQTQEALHLMESETGKYIASATHRIFRNRNWLVISPNSTTSAETILIQETDSLVHFPAGTLHLQPSNASTLQPSNLPTSNNIAVLDATHITYPLILRKWKPGDYFYPLGMRKKKKLARFFIDNKLSITEKENTWLLESNKKILWIIGQRIDDRFKITDQVGKELRIEFR